ncbi:Pantothenate precursors transporter PanS [Dyadobacter sp. CECT 9275]|uniref:Pantothenates transporter PanS n=2 Tax=Dyadobacter helix TaxID=2822344 RepID=A0A916JHE4_9BACT|nr:Pantothenate precursors transporter PanS [Dyadobacter sp. CECT 9275]
MIFNDSIASAGPFFITFLVALSIGFRGIPLLKGLAFTVFILGISATALYYPAPFIEINGFELAGLITPLIQLIMFGTGSSMGFKDFVELSKSPKSVIVGVIAHFLIMPSLGFLLAKANDFSPEISAGIILLGCSPTSVTASLFSYLAKANVALAITVTSLTTLLAPLLIPLLMKLFAGGFIEIDVLNMMWGMIKIVVLPIAAGLLINKLLSTRAQWLHAWMPFVSMFGVTLIVAIIMAAGRDSILNIGLMLLLVVLALNLLGYLLGYWAAKLCRLSERDARTIALVTGMQNAGLVSGIAKVMGKIATVGLASAICGPIMGLTASVLSSYWSGSPVKEDRKDNPEA